MIDFPTSEFETTKRDAASSVGKSVEERTAMFLQLMEWVDAIQSHLSPEERERRARIADLLDPLPDPWWKNFRKEALAEFECQTSSI
jgi:hypothetical protein